LRNTASGSHDLLDDGVAKLHRLNLLRDQLVGGAKGVAALRAEIASAVAATHAYALSVSGVTGVGQTASAEQAAQALRAASDTAHQTVANFSRDFYERKIFDPYLKFASTEDEEAYRRREAERQRTIDKAMAENTPEGNLKANRLALAQLDDAGAHGADRSPDFRKWHSKLTKEGDGLADAIDRSTHSAPVTARIEQRDSVKPDSKLSPELLAALREAGVTVPDQGGTGHGVTRGKPVDRAIQPT
jgi:hypothetical protein